MHVTILYGPKKEGKMKKWILMASLCLVAVAAQAQSYKEYVRKALDAMSMDSTEVTECLYMLDS